MKLEDLKDWDTLTPEEQKRLRDIYGDEVDITKTMHDTNADSLKKVKHG